MEASASAPALGTSAFDYKLPCKGVGDTGPASKVQLGFSYKDTGEHSSRINQIVKEAKKVPGPGKYVAHSDWKMTQTNKFCNSSREYKPMHKNPAPVHYEAKDFAMTKSIGARQNISTNPRTQFGKINPGKRKSFMDGAVKHGASTPGPGAHNPPPGCSTSLGVGPRKMLSWDREKSKSVSMKVKVPDIAPNHYTINYSKTEPSLPTYTVSKEKGANFIDRFTREKNIKDHGFDGSNKPKKKELPGPGTYDMQNFNLDKTSRGTFHLQLRGLTRAPASGFF